MLSFFAVAFGIADPYGPAESKGQEIVQIKQLVSGITEGPGDPLEQSAQPAVFPLGKPAAERNPPARLRRLWPAEGEDNRGAPDRVGTIRMSQIYEGLEKCVHHLAVREGDGYIQSKILRAGKAAH